MGYNMLTGTISSSELPSDLLGLFLWLNEFTGSIPDVSGFSTLSYLILSYNFLSSTIPDASQFPSTLQFPFLGDNDLTGTLPDLSSLPLVYLDTSYNVFDDQPLPSWLFGADFLTGGMYLGSNQFTGTIPLNIYQSPSEGIVLPHNELTGSISTVMGMMTNLKVLDLADNENLGQTFSLGWSTNVFNDMIALEEFRIDNTNFDGTIIDALCDIEFTYEDTSIVHSCS